MGRACSTCGGEYAYRGLSGILKERDHLENAEVDRKIHFKRILQKYVLKASIGLLWLRIETKSGCSGRSGATSSNWELLEKNSFRGMTKCSSSSYIGSFYTPSQNFEKQLLASSCLSVCLHGTTRLQWTEFYEIWYFCIFETLSRQFECHKNLTRTAGTLHADQYINIQGYS